MSSLEPVAGMAAAEPDGGLARKGNGWTMPWKVVLFMLVGAVLGFAYYRLVGCRTGACPITSSPYISTLYGALIGFLASRGP